MFDIIGVVQINLQVHGVAWNWILKPLTLPDIFRLTTSPDQAFDPIVRVGKSAANQPDNPRAYYQPQSFSVCVLHLSDSLSFHAGLLFLLFLHSFWIQKSFLFF